MNDMVNQEGDRVAKDAARDKRSWVTPAVRVEQVSDVTKNVPGNGGDLTNCHS